MLDLIALVLISGMVSLDAVSLVLVATGGWPRSDAELTTARTTLQQAFNIRVGGALGAAALYVAGCGLVAFGYPIYLQPIALCAVALCAATLLTAAQIRWLLPKRVEEV